MAAAAMPGGTTPSSPLRPPAPPLRPSSPTASIPSGEIHGDTPASGKVRGEPQFGPKSADVEISAASDRSQWGAGDVRGGEQEASRVLIRMKQETGEAPVEQRDKVSSKKSSKKKTTLQEETHPTAGSKRPLSDNGGSSRAIKAAKIINEKVVLKQLQNKYVGRKISPIVSGSRMINMMARQRAQSLARSPKSVGTLKSPSLLDLSPSAAHATPSSMHDVSPAVTTHDVSPAAPTHGPHRKARKLTSKIWKDAEPIYVDGFLMEGKCNYCSEIFPASKVSGTSTLGRHIKVCEVKKINGWCD